MSKQRSILILDNLPEWREELVETLQQNGYYADSASSTIEALEKLNATPFHILILDIRLDENDPSNIEGIGLLEELHKRGLSGAIKVIMLSAFGTRERMRTLFREYEVADFLFKDEFSKRELLETVQRVFSKDVRINLELVVHWQQINGPERAVINLKIGESSIKPDTALQKHIAGELEDLLCRLFYRAKSVLVRPLTQGYSGAGVLRVQPFYTGGSGHEVVIKYGAFQKIEEEYYNFKEYVQPFLGGGRNSIALDFRRTPHLGGIIYSLLGTINDQLVDFETFYHRSDVPKIKEVLGRLFRDTCGAWYANHNHLEPLNLTQVYQQLLQYTPEMLEQVVFEQLQSVQGRQSLRFNHLRSRHGFTNPFHVLATLGQPLVRTTYSCITHGDLNQQNLLVDSTDHIWMIDFQETGQSHILRDVALLDSVIRFQLLSSGEASLKERLQMEEALCSIDLVSQVKQLDNKLSTENQALAKTYAIVVYLRSLVHWLVNQNPSNDLSEYYIALLYVALNTLRFSSLQPVQREHALLSASLLVDKLGLSNK